MACFDLWGNLTYLITLRVSLYIFRQKVLTGIILVRTCKRLNLLCDGPVIPFNTVLKTKHT